MADVEGDIKLLRDQVGALQVAAAEKKAPWYRQTPSLVSVLALIGSIVTFVLTQFQQSAQEIRAQKEELRKSLETLLTMREDFNTRVAGITNNATRDLFSGMASAKQQIYLAAVEDVTEKLGKHVSAAEYLPIAAEFFSTGNSRKAEMYYLAGIKAVNAKANSDVLTKVDLLDGLAELYFTPSDLYNLKNGRKAFEDAVNAVGDPGGNDSLSIELGTTYSYWGQAELLSGNQTEGEEKIQLSRKYYLQMSMMNPVRSYLLSNDDSVESRLSSQVSSHR